MAFALHFLLPSAFCLVEVEESFSNLDYENFYYLTGKESCVIFYIIVYISQLISLDF